MKTRPTGSDRVKAMIENQKEKYGWEFLFIGANIDAVETAKHFGIDADRAVDYHADRLSSVFLMPRFILRKVMKKYKC